MTDSLRSLVADLEPRQHLLVTGGTGFIGSRLVAALDAAGHEIIVLSRRAAPSGLPDGVAVVNDLEHIDASARIDAIVNLAGAPIADRPWTEARRRLLVESRVATTQAVVDLIARLRSRPRVLISGSAIGWYGIRGSEILDEESAPKSCFSGDLCRKWEAAATQAAVHDVRVALLRIGLVVGPGGGLVARMALPFRLGLGGPMGDGQQYMSWVTRDDLVRSIAFLIASDLSGPFNATAPGPVTNKTFCRALGAALRRPVWLRVPAAPLRLIAGDLARELLLGGQRVLPRRLLQSGFEFKDTDLTVALGNVFERD